MKSIRASRCVLAAGVVACAALGILLRSSQLRGESIREGLAARTPPPAAEHSVQHHHVPTAAAAETDHAAAAAERRELAERAALLEQARRVPEVARREAALRVIKRIQAEQAATPPPPRPVPPPEPRDAMFFAELLDDPEYLQLVAQRWRLMQGAPIERRLAKLGLPDDVCQRVIELEFDSYTASLDVQRYTRAADADRGAALAASRDLRAENHAAIQQLLGEQAHAAYRGPDPARVTQSRIPEAVLRPLATRLSYSGSPLDAATRQRLVDMLQTIVPSQPALYPTILERARAVLQPGQVAALEELQAEYEAMQARRQLPKSSELPRTTRRQRLEAVPR